MEETIGGSTTTLIGLEICGQHFRFTIVVRLVTLVVFVSMAHIAAHHEAQLHDISLCSLPVWVFSLLSFLPQCLA